MTCFHLLSSVCLDTVQQYTMYSSKITTAQNTVTTLHYSKHTKTYLFRGSEEKEFVLLVQRYYASHIIIFHQLQQTKIKGAI